MPQDGNTFYLEDNTFVRLHDDGIKIYKTRDHKPDGPDSMQVTAGKDEALALASFILEQIGEPAAYSQESDSEIIADPDNAEDAKDAEDGDPAESEASPAKKNSGSNSKVTSGQKDKAKGAAVKTGATPVKTTGKATKKK